MAIATTRADNMPVFSAAFAEVFQPIVAQNLPAARDKLEIGEYLHEIRPKAGLLLDDRVKRALPFDQWRNSCHGRQGFER
jgi:hypothetical protein